MGTAKEVLGVDVGGVILDFVPYFKTEFDFSSDNYLQTPEIDGAIAAIAELHQGKFKNRIHLVSKHPKEHGPERIMTWLRSRGFFDKTGIPVANFHPCVERYEKVAICEELGITHFVDDRAEVLKHMLGHIENLYLFKSTDAHEEEFATILSQVQRVSSWNELSDLLK